MTHSIVNKSKSFGEKISCLGSASVNGPVSYCWTDPPTSNKLWTKDSNVKTLKFDRVKFWSREDTWMKGTRECALWGS